MASRNHFRVAQGNGHTRRFNCLTCRRRVFYGDRCPGCQRDLRLRQYYRKRKPR